ncbi:MAG TPA: sigma-54 dependent transcriptional regulator [Spirochaetia bacterium]|nr:sigma-54 dependent transcriptional regulator [Spirochaetia bacterium]
MKQILLVDDEKNMRTVLALLFEREGYSVRSASTGEDAMYALRAGIFDLVITDLKMPVMDGMSLLEAVHAEGIETPIVVITAFGTIEKAVEAMKKGAVDFVTKPFKNDEILHVVSRALEVDQLKQQNRFLQQQMTGSELIYKSGAMNDIMTMIRKVGPVSTPVLLTGESGVGKEVVARTIHRIYAGDREYVPFVSINCPAVPEPLLESELFGYRKGAFTGASKDFKGKIRLAEHGTLFLDEIGDLPMAIQPKLLRLLETKTVEPLGSSESVRISTRIICATNRDLKQQVRGGHFREDLFYRINTIAIEVPPVRERRDDISELVAHFLHRYCLELGKTQAHLSEEAAAAIYAYNWPGNVREIKNVIERAVVLSTSDVIGLADLPAELHTPAGRASEGNKLETMERDALFGALDSSGWNVSAAARRLGITRNTIRYRMQKYGIGQSEEPVDSMTAG